MELPALKDFSPKELLQLTGKILDELSARKIVRTNNNPVSGYSEWLVSERLGLALCGNSEKGFDSTDKSGAKYALVAATSSDTTIVTGMKARNSTQGEIPAAFITMISESVDSLLSVCAAATNSAIGAITSTSNGMIRLVMPIKTRIDWP